MSIKRPLVNTNICSRHAVYSTCIGFEMFNVCEFPAVGVTGLINAAH